ncbi:hypothetical protein [Ramlibacter sp. AN1133]|uniref:hypothetical protein n=1 Tax=Ramlibacter sp. AN1133 TaxID=3133429 RepID=UPI0030C227BF
MSQTHDSPVADDDGTHDDPWGTLNATRQTSATENLGAAGGEPFHDGEHVVDTTATEVPTPAKNSIVPKLVIGLVMVAVLGATGSGLYKLYRGMFPPPEIAAAEPQVEVPRQPPSAAAALPGVAQPAGVASTIGAAPATPQIDPTAVAAAPSAATVASTPSLVAPAAKPVDAPVVAAPKASTAAPVATPPAAAEPLAVAEAKPAHQAAALRASKPHTAPKPGRAATQVASSQHVKAKPARRAAPATSTPPDVASDVEQSASAVLVGYRVESIEPRFGEHQNAWVRRRDGRLVVLSAGDAFEGGRVTRVDGAAFQVQTTNGVIR